MFDVTLKIIRKTKTKTKTPKKDNDAQWIIVDDTSGWSLIEDDWNIVY